ncbi:MAG: polyprenol monophosphomannose synthase [Pyrinomonadaceae bacterium]
MADTSDAAVQKCWVVLPTYCEADNLGVIIDRLGQTGLALNILIVDDNSPDGTGDIAAALAADHSNIHLLRRLSKSGLGSAYLAGFAHAIDAGADVVITMDSDLSHEPKVLPQMLDKLSDAGCVVGSRYIPGGSIVNWPFRRRVLSAAANHFVRLLFQIPVKDCTSGYRVYRRSVIDDILRIGPRSQGYSFQVEALRIAVSGRLPVVESPICFVERVAGKSKMGIREVVHGGARLCTLRLGSLNIGPKPDNTNE